MPSGRRRICERSRERIEHQVSLIAADAKVGAGATVGEDAEVGAGSIVGAGATKTA
jgi:acetyltransferase-like isoleucine patch superfamily enzyme